jgi:hypothetical protein
MGGIAGVLRDGNGGFKEIILVLFLVGGDWNHVFFIFHWEWNIPTDELIFSEGLNPPTRFICFKMVFFIMC